jgi:hypothetical protein
VARLALRAARDRLFALLLTGALLETVWTIYLAWRLPRHYVANHWDLAWVGLDVAEIVILFAAAWAAWHRRATLIAYSIASATLLLLDAWFDVTTASRGDVVESVLVAIFVEVPSAIALLYLARRAAKRLFTSHYSASELGSMPVWKIPLSPTSEDYK